jgi:hypothetical protein
MIDRIVRPNTSPELGGDSGVQLLAGGRADAIVLPELMFRRIEMRGACRPQAMPCRDRLNGESSARS